MADLTSRLILSLIDRVTAPARGVQRAMGNLTGSIERNQRAIAQTQGSLLGAGAAFTAFAYALRAPVAAAMEFQDAMLDIQKVSNFETPEAFAQFEADLIALSRRIPLSIAELQGLAEAAGSAGFESSEILTYVENAAKVATAWDINSSAAGDFFNAMDATLGFSLDRTMALADAMNHLADNTATNGADLSETMTRTAGSFGNFGFAAEEAAAFQAAMLSAQFPAEVVATSFLNMGRAMTRNTNTSKRQRDAMAEIGMTFEEVAVQMQDDAVGTTLAVMEAIGELPAHMRSSVTSAIFGEEARALTGIIADTDKLREALGLVRTEAEGTAQAYEDVRDESGRIRPPPSRPGAGPGPAFAGSIEREYEIRLAAFSAEVQLFKNTLRELQIAIGTALMPGLTRTMDFLTPYVHQVTDFVNANQELVASAAQVVGALLGLRVAFLGLKLLGLVGKGGALWLMAGAFGAIGRSAAGLTRAAQGSIALQAALAAMDGSKMTGWDKVRAGLSGMARLTGLGAVASGVAALVAAVATISAPVWLGIAAALGVLAVAGGWVYRNFERISAVFEGIERAVEEALRPALEWLRTTLPTMSVPANIIQGFQILGEAARGVGNDVIQGFGIMRDYLTGFNLGQDILSDAERDAVIARAQAIATGIINWLQDTAKRAAGIGAAIVNNLTSGIREAGAAAIAAAQEIANGIANALERTYGGGAMAPESEMGVATTPAGDSTGFASGGHMRAGPAIVGERGPETIWADRSAYVASLEASRRVVAMSRRASSMVPAARSAGVSGSSRAGGPVSQVMTIGDIHVHGSPQSSPRDIAAEFGREARSLMWSQHGDTL